MWKRNLETELSAGEPPAKVRKSEPSVADPTDQSRRMRRARQDSITRSSHNMPPSEHSGAVSGPGVEAPRGREPPAATDDGMTPESGVRAGVDVISQKGYDPPDDTKHAAADTAPGDRADITLYRQHFAGYQEPRAHLSSNPYIESDRRLEDGKHHHHFPGERQEGTNTYERRADPSSVYPRAATGRAGGGVASQYTTRSLNMSADTRQEQVPPAFRPEERPTETRGDRGGQWTERVRSLRDHAEAHGASLRSMSPDNADNDPTTFNSDAPGAKRRSKPERENEVQGKEATMALYSYPRRESGMKFFRQIPEGRREELEEARKNLKEMEEKLQNATKERINEVSATLNTAPSSSRSVPQPRRD